MWNLASFKKFEKLKSDCNKTWVLDTKWEPLLTWSKVTYQGQRSSEVKFQKKNLGWPIWDRCPYFAIINTFIFCNLVGVICYKLCIFEGINISHIFILLFPVWLFCDIYIVWETKTNKLRYEIQLNLKFEVWMFSNI